MGAQHVPEVYHNISDVVLTQLCNKNVLHCSFVDTITAEATLVVTPTAMWHDVAVWVGIRSLDILKTEIKIDEVMSWFVD